MVARNEEEVNDREQATLATLALIAIALLACSIIDMIWRIIANT